MLLLLGDEKFTVSAMLIQMHVAKVDADPHTHTHVLLLQESEGTRCVPLWIASLEASAIVFALESVLTSRPMTHDLLKTVIHQMGGELLRVCITGILQDVYVARLDVQKGRTLIQIDARPSDAIALALRCGTPVFCEDSLCEPMKHKPSMPERKNVYTHGRDLEHLPKKVFGKYKM